MFRTCVYMYACVYVYACPMPPCIITFVRYSVQKSIRMCVPPPLLSINLWQPLSVSPLLYLIFHG